MDERTRRVGQNEALYRQANERINELNTDFAQITENFSIACECGDGECAERIDVPQDRYEQTRQNATRFIVLPGHEKPEAERVVEGEQAYVIVEKTPPEARRRAEESDPRS